MGDPVRRPRTLDNRHCGYTLAPRISRSIREPTLCRVSNWGNSLAVRLPTTVVEALDLHEGDDIEIQVEGSRSLSAHKAPDNQELLARLRKYRGRLPEGFCFDRLEFADCRGCAAGRL